MKTKVLLNSAIIFLLGLILNSCEKEKYENNLPKIPVTDFSLTVENNKLVFPTVSDYEKAIAYLGRIGDDNFDSWEQSIGFKSMRNEMGLEKDTLIKDALLGTLINKAYEVVIEGYCFVLNLRSEQVNVTKVKDNLKSSQGVMVYSTNIDVIDAVFYQGDQQPVDENSLKSTMEDKVGPYYWDVSTGQKVEYKVVYQAAGIYFSLQSKIKHQNHVGCDGWIEIGLNVEPGCKYKPKNRKEHSIPEHAEGGYCREYNYRAYEAMRRLDKYHFYVNFYYNDVMYGGGNSAVIGINKGY